MRVCVIAEIGVNHNGQYEAAERLIDAAIAAGADAVKLQAFSAESLVSRDTPLASYQAEKTSYQDQNQMLSRLQLSVDELKALMYVSYDDNTLYALSQGMCWTKYKAQKIHGNALRKLRRRLKFDFDWELETI